jgi:citrate lyase beta subunit
MSDGRIKFAKVRSLLEVPILIEKFWSKVPEVAADAIMLDLEDSATPAQKDEARERIVAALGDMDYFGGRPVIVRCNNLATPWAEDDLAALGAVDADFVISYPKVETADELAEVKARLEGAGRPHGLHVMIETAKAVANLYDIAAVPGVDGLHYGYVDFAADVGSRVFDDDGLFGPSNYYVQMAISVAAAANGLFATGGSLIPDFKDLDKVRAHVKVWADLGYTACIGVSPAHLAIINELMAPSPAQVEAAQQVIDAYDAAVAEGKPAAVHGGKVITLPDYRVAQRAVARAG